MKRERILKALAILAVAALGLFVSCSGNIMDDVSDTLVYATFDKNSRATSTYTQTLKLKDIGEVYWTYTATKKDSAGTTGATSDEIAVKSDYSTGLDGVIGPFSQGTWEFKVFGYAERLIQASDPTGSDWVKVLNYSGNNVYYCEKIYESTTAAKAELTTGTKNSPDPINVIINLLSTASTTGTFAIKNTSDFHWNTTGGDVSEEAVESTESSNSKSTTITKKIDMYLKLGGRKENNSSQTDYIKLTFVAENSGTNTSAYYKIADGEVVLWKGTDAGSFDLTASIVRAEKTTTTKTQEDGTSTSTSEVSYKDLNIYATSPTLVMKVYTGQTTNLEANVIEGNFAYGIINGTIEGKNLSTTTTVTKTIESGVDTILSSSISPASVSSGSVSTSNSTTVTIPSNVASFASGKTASMTVTATPIVTANSTYIISDSSKGAVGAIEISAAVIDSEGTSTSVTEFKDSTDQAVAVTVVTYIAKGMTNVTVTYNGTGDEPSDVVYDANTGKLTYKTTHFSTFLVGADQNVYDESTNTAYTLASDGKIKDKNNKEKAIADLGSFLVLFDCALSNDVLDEWIKSYDNEEGKAWAVIHHNCPNYGVTDDYCLHCQLSSYFDSGYGTKLEPYMIASKKQFGKIGTFWNYYGYYKIDESYPEADLTLDDWNTVDIHGSFDGNGKTFKKVNRSIFDVYCKNYKNGTVNYPDKEEIAVLKNFDAEIDMNANAGALVWSVYNKGTTTFKNINLSGRIVAQENTGSFYAYGNGWQTPYTVKFEDCKSNVDLYSIYSGPFGGFVGHTFGNATFYIDDNSEYTGTIYSSDGKTGNQFVGIDEMTFNKNGKNNDTASDKWKKEQLKQVTPEKKTSENGVSLGYTATFEKGVSSVDVVVKAQLTSYKEDGGGYKVEMDGYTFTLGRLKYDPVETDAILFGAVTSVKITNDTTKNYEYSLSGDGLLTVNIPQTYTYSTGTVSLIVTQYNAGGTPECSGQLVIAENKTPNETTWDSSCVK